MLAASVLALGSAGLHAGWNLFVKTRGDPLVAAWGTTTAGAAFAVGILAALGLPEASATPYLVASAVLHLAYTLLLVGAYRANDFSVAYPIARGVAPLLIAVGGGLFLSDPLTPLGVAGTAVVTGGLVWIGLSSGEQGRLFWPVATGIAITAYTLVDTAGVRAADESLRYVSAMLALSALLITATVLVVRPRSGLLAAVREDGGRLLLSGGMALAAYAMVLAAVRLAPVGYVATLRETSVVLAALAGWLLLQERMGFRRTGGAVAVTLGVALLSVTL